MPVKTLVAEPISKTVSPSGCVSSSRPSLPWPTTIRPSSSMNPTTIPTLCFATSIRSLRIAWICSSDQPSAAAAVAGTRTRHTNHAIHLMLSPRRIF